VPELRAAEGAKEGVVMTRDFPEFIKDLMRESDESRMVLSRVNAPLLGMAFKLLANGRRAFIQGRDIGAGILGQVKKIAPDNISELVSGYDEISNRMIMTESAKQFPDPAKIELFGDRNDCVQMIANQVETVDEFDHMIKSLFKDVGQPGDVRFSSVHRSKGLEADRVCIYDPGKLPYRKFMEGMQTQQELNLAYVADTRSMDTLEYVNPPEHSKSKDDSMDEVETVTGTTDRDY
jgi:hypothetical protein